MHRPDMDQIYGGGMLAFEYARSFDSSKLANCMFGGSNLLFQGSQVVDRSSRALIADYFGLSQQFNGSICLNPVIQNFNLHFIGFVGFDEWVRGLWFKFDMTFSHQKRSLTSDCNSCCNTIVTTSNPNFPAGYMGAGPGAVTPIQSITDALTGTNTFGDMNTPWNAGRWVFCGQTESGIAGLSLNLGYDFYNCDNNYFGVFFRTTAPTGSKSSADYVFNAVVGNGKFWEVGAGVCGRWECWTNSDYQKLAFLLDGYVTSLINAHHTRTFDFNYSSTTVPSANNCLSRYVLLKQLSFDPTTGYSYAGNLINAVNFTTRRVASHISVKGDATLRMIYTHGGVDLGFGYNIYGQSREKITSIGAPCGLAGTLYGIKGCQGMALNEYAESTGTIDSTPPTGFTSLPLNATASAATAYNCGGNVPDNPALVAVAGQFVIPWNSNSNNSTIVAGASVGTLSLASDYLVSYSSNPPIILGDSDLNLCSGAAPSQLTNKGFMSLDYTWLDNDWSPFIGTGVEVEGGTGDCSVSQWGIWLRGGISY